MSLASIPSAPADLELIAQLKSKLQHAELRIRVLEARLRLMRIDKYGAGGEKLSQAQMQLFELEPVVSEMTEQAESEHAPVHRSTKKSVKHPGRQELPANLPRVERILPCALDQRVCKRCGKETVVIGYEESSHARRQFFEAVQLNPRDPVATPIVARMDELFAVEADARRKAPTIAARHFRRKETAKSLLDDIRSKIEAAQSFALPSSALSKACQYTLTLWKKLTRFLEHPELELSTNLAENSMRPVALGRKNWLHIGSPQAGPKVAAILSIVESCRRLKLSVRNYLAAVLPGLADLSIQHLPELTPTAWAMQCQ